jgi:hypothetical protein
VVWCAFDRDNSMLVFDELYPEGLTVPQIAAQIKAKNLEWGVDPIYVIDPSARNRALTNAETVIGEFNRAGIYPVPGQNDREAGILQLKARLHGGTFRVAQNCAKWLWESDRYLVASDEISSEQKNKVKGAGGSFATIGPDHLLDPTRYVAMERLWFSPAMERVQRSRQWRPGEALPASALLGRESSAGPPMGSMS